MLALFKRNDIAAFIGVIVMAFICKAYIIIHPPHWQEIDNLHRGFFFSWNGLATFYKNHPSLYLFFSTIVLIIMAFYFNYVVVDAKLFLRKSFISALAFVLYSSFIPSLSIFSVPLLASFFILVAFAKALGLAQTQSPKKSLFQIGVFASLAALFYFPAILFFLLFLLLFVFFRPVSIQEFTAYLIGYVTPIYFTAMLLYIFGNYTNSIHHLYWHIHLPVNIIHPRFTILLGVLSTCIVVYGWFTYNQGQAKLPIGIRKKWNAIGLYFIFAILAGAFSKLFPGITWVFILAPFSILLSQSMQANREKVNIFTFYFLMTVLLLVQWVLKY